MIRHFAILFIHLIVTVGRLFGPGGARSVVAELLLVRHQLLIINRSRQRAPAEGATVLPYEKSGSADRKIARLDDYRWEKCCRGLYQLPAAA